MEHAFDMLSKKVARAVSRREVIGTLLRGTVGIFLMSTGFAGRSARAQSTACSACGTCATLNVTTDEMTTCTESCETQTLCNAAQSYAPYQLLTATLEGNFQAASYDALISIYGASQMQLFHTAYVSPTDSTQTADLFVAWRSSTEVIAFAVLYSAGNPMGSYVVKDSSVVQLLPPPQIPPPFVVSGSPSSLLVSQQSSTTSTIGTTVASGFDAAIGLTASGLPSGATASFNPKTIAAPGSGSSVMKIRADRATTIGVYPITVTGTTSKGLAQSASLWLTVTTAGVGAITVRDVESVSDPDPASNDALVPSTNDYESKEIGNSSAEDCANFCRAAKKASTFLNGIWCTDAFAAAAVEECGFTGPAAPECAAGATIVDSVLTIACKYGYPALMNYYCTQKCKCGRCESISITGTCTPVCSASSCPVPGMCDPESCGCIEPACGTGAFPCGPGGCCENGQPCIENPYGQWGCGPVGWIACPVTGSACEPGTSCCGIVSGSSTINFCCSPGESCFSYPEGPAVGCVAPGETPCGLPGYGSIWACAGGETCGSTFESCVSS